MVEKSAIPDAARVLIGPALMPFTRVPSGPSDAAMQRTFASSAAFATPIVL